MTQPIRGRADAAVPRESPPSGRQDPEGPPDGWTSETRRTPGGAPALSAARARAG